MLRTFGLDPFMDTQHYATDALRRESGRLLTQEQVADYLQMPVRTMEAWRYSGDGPKFVRIGRRVRYRPQDVEEWVESQVAA